ncbi:ABC transporter ATP-binding protein [Celerinatantimonas sp. MCCC 1A17872]|uniref:ABC transporter ATP-binding protein n=1 Tax=Celerinatantimonas sp. MCCC 1A17872 TaxID=3177514 RepID=UPI0038C28FE0
MQPLLQVNHLTITNSDGVKLVDDVSFSLNQGQMLGLVGESGSGKTLTCRAIMRLLPNPSLHISSGEVLFQGQDILKLSERQMRRVRGQGIGMIFQNPATHIDPLMSIGQQMMEGLKQSQKLKRADARQRAVELLTQVGIPSPKERLNNYAHEFSGGMRQRAMIAIALSCNPQVLIADEPTTALDVTVQAQILKLLNELQQQHQLAIIMITHDLGVVAQTCDQTAVLYGGRLCETAPTRALLSQPNHPYTQGLISCQPSANQSATGALKTIAGTPPVASHMPQGCRFHPRCPNEQKICESQVPKLCKTSHSHEHSLACHFPLNAQKVCHHE